jgi:hypothetical protein
MTYRSQSARDAVGLYSASYCEYLDRHAVELAAYFTERGDTARAARMLTRSLSESLMGNDGE